jgi:hypothetical protein
MLENPLAASALVIGRKERKPNDVPGARRPLRNDLISLGFSLRNSAKSFLEASLQKGFWCKLERFGCQRYRLE